MITRTLIVTFVCTLFLTACEKEKGPMEEMGEKMDEATEEVKDAADDI